jgi:hypothetical protein
VLELGQVQLVLVMVLRHLQPRLLLAAVLVELVELVELVLLPLLLTFLGKLLAPLGICLIPL